MQSQDSSFVFHYHSLLPFQTQVYLYILLHSHVHSITHQPIAQTNLAKILPQLDAQKQKTEATRSTDMPNRR